jgi:hypothetical protein
LRDNYYKGGSDELIAAFSFGAMRGFSSRPAQNGRPSAFPRNLQGRRGGASSLTLVCRPPCPLGFGHLSRRAEGEARQQRKQKEEKKEEEKKEEKE